MNPTGDIRFLQSVLVVAGVSVVVMRPLFVAFAPGVVDPWWGRLAVAAVCGGLLLLTTLPGAPRWTQQLLHAVTTTFAVWLVGLMTWNGYPDAYQVGALLTAVGSMVLFRTWGQVVGFGAAMGAAVAATAWATDTPRGALLVGSMGVATTLVAMATHRRNEVEAELELARRELAGRVEARTADLVHRTRDLEREAEVRRAAEADALAGTRAKSAFLAAMSHELRTPLNAILGYADLVAEELDEPPAATADLARIRTAGLQLLALVDEVLDLARVESGRAEVVRRPFAVRSLVEDVVSTLRPMAARSDTALDVEIDPDAASMVGDQARTRQILLNLASNAVRCTPRGHVTVRVTRSAGEQRFEVIDDGPGLPPEVRARLFQRFAPTAAGTGLGLAISHELAALLGGRLELVDTAAGTTFRLSLPE